MTCEDCKGKGRVKLEDGRIVKCSRCNGTGDICDVCGEPVDDAGMNICDSCRHEMERE